MEVVVKKRKKRNDKMHIVYVLLNTVTDEQYVGISVCVDRSGKKTLKDRWTRHVGRAFLQNKDWALCKSIREHGPEVFVPMILDIVRGKATAHTYENALRKTKQYALNTL